MEHRPDTFAATPGPTSPAPGTPGGPVPPRPADASGDASDLARRLVARDELALADLYDRHGAGVYGLILRIVRSPGDAEEVTQEVFLYAWDRARQFDPGRGSMTTWLFTLARSRAIDRIRSFRSQERRREGLRLEQAASAGVSPPLPDRAAEQADARTGVRAALAGLVAEQREVLELAYFDGLSQSEIAEHLRTPLGTVKTRMRQGMIRLRDALAALSGLMEPS